MKFDALTARIVLRAVSQLCRANEATARIMCDTLASFHPDNDFALFEYIMNSALKVPEEIKNLRDDDAWRWAMRGFIEGS